MTTHATPAAATSHAAHITDQFTRQAEIFARSRALHNKAALDLLVDAAKPAPADVSLDVACGPGSVALAFAERVAHASGLDATEAMLDQARKAATEAAIANVSWHRGDAYALPFAAASFDIVSCRFTMHHLEQPARAFAEMVRVCRPGGRVVLCDAMASDDAAKAAAFNAMERHRDPSTVQFRTLGYLRGMFAAAGLPTPDASFFAVPFTLQEMVKRSFPVGDDREQLRATLASSVDGDALGMDARPEGDTVRFAYQSVVLVAVKG